MPECMVAVVGSCADRRAQELGLKKPAEGEAAAVRLGRVLAEHGCGLLVYSAHSDFIENKVVEGYVAGIAEDSHSDGAIQVHHPSGDRDGKFAGETEHEALFSFHPTRASSWDVAFYRSLWAADAVLLIGGGHSTFVAGILAASLRKPLVAIPVFGGKASEVWRELSPEGNYLSQADLNLMAQEWRNDSANKLVNNLLEQKARVGTTRKVRAEISKSTVAALVAIALFVVAVLAIPFTWDATGIGRQTLMILLVLVPIMVGISGALVRPIIAAQQGLDIPAERPLVQTGALGALAGGIAGLLFVMAQLVAVSPEVQAEVWLKQAGRLMPFALIVGLIGGLTLDAVFRRLSNVEVGRTDVLDRLPGADGRARPLDKNATPNKA